MAWYRLAIAATIVSSLLIGCGGSDSSSPSTSAPTQDAGTLKVLSNRADLVSGGDALMEFVPASGINVKDVQVALNGSDVTQSFATRADGRFVGLVTGLTSGSNKVSATAGSASSSITLTNHANGSPVLYGPQIAPWTCDAGSVDASCNRPATFTYFYKSTDVTKTSLLAYDPAHPASDVANTQTDDGVSVPFIVRIETGILNRDYYSIAVLFDGSQDWKPWAPQKGWNHKVVFMHGAGYGMGFSPFVDITSPRVQSVTPLARGFAVMTTALNDTGHNSNIAVQGESMMMLKEHFIEAYGEVRYSIGVGGSGGALAQQWVANAYPGIYNGIIVNASFPDGASPLTEIEDCGLLHRYLSDATQWSPGISWTSAQVVAAQGQVGDVCNDWAHGIRALGANVDFGFTQMFDPSHQGTFAYPTISPTSFGGCDLATAYVYQATFNPTGVRCSAQDYLVGIVGKRPTDMFAKRVYSNVGVQYGLSALKAGTISVDQFVDLNTKVGSHSIDFAYQPFRVAADEGVMASAYRSGYLNSANNLNQVAMLDVRGPDTAGIHHQYRSWAMRARLDNVQGHHKNQVLWFNAGLSADQALAAMDGWLAAVANDKSSATTAAKIVGNRPSTLIDLCGTADGTNLGMVQCTGVPDGSTRMAAGAPLSDDVLECQLAPLDRNAYGVAFSDAQWAQLQSAFPTGVCDYTKAGNGQQATQAWQSYINADGTIVYGGAPLGPAPTSVNQ